MPIKNPICPEIKAEILTKIRLGEMNVSEASRAYAVAKSTIFNWINRGNEPSVVGKPEYQRLQNKNKELYEIIGELTAEINAMKKLKKLI